MTYYNQTSKQEVEAMQASLGADGIQASISNNTCTITRETSFYNKYLKWHAVETAENGSVFSDYFRTKKEAVEYFTKPTRPLPVGDRMLLGYVQLAY